MNKTALITGATSGIGRATAHEFAKQGINLILCGRRQERLDTIEKALEILTLETKKKYLRQLIVYQKHLNILTY